MSKPKRKPRSKKNDDDLFNLDLSEPLFDEEEFSAEMDKLKEELANTDWDDLMSKAANHDVLTELYSGFDYDGDWSEFDSLFDD